MASTCAEPLLAPLLSVLQSPFFHSEAWNTLALLQPMLLAADSSVATSGSTAAPAPVPAGRHAAAVLLSAACSCLAEAPETKQKQASTAAPESAPLMKASQAAPLQSREGPEGSATARHMSRQGSQRSPSRDSSPAPAATPVPEELTATPSRTEWQDQKWKQTLAGADSTGGSVAALARLLLRAVHAVAHNPPPPEDVPDLVELALAAFDHSMQGICHCSLPEGQGTDALGQAAATVWTWTAQRCSAAQLVQQMLPAWQRILQGICTAAAAVSADGAAVAAGLLHASPLLAAASVRLPYLGASMTLACCTLAGF